MFDGSPPEFRQRAKQMRPFTHYPSPVRRQKRFLLSRRSTGCILRRFLPALVPALLRLARTLDRFADRTGNLLAWLTLVMVLVGAGNALFRTLDRTLQLGVTSNLWLELQWYLFAAVFLLGAAWTLRADAHVRVDVLYGRLSEKGRAWIDLVGALLMLIPFCVLMLWASGSYVAASWRVWEQSPDPGGLPRFPVKVLIPVGFALLLVQSVSFVAKRVAVLRGLVATPEEV